MSSAALFACLPVFKQAAYIWLKEAVFLRCGLVTPYLKSAFLCGFPVSPIPENQELEGKM